MSRGNWYRWHTQNCCPLCRSSSIYLLYITKILGLCWNFCNWSLWQRYKRHRRRGIVKFNYCKNKKFFAIYYEIYHRMNPLCYLNVSHNVYKWFRVWLCTYPSLSLNTWGKNLLIPWPLGRQVINQDFIHWADGRLTARAREVSRPQDPSSDCPSRSVIWQAYRQQRCRDACQIAGRYDHNNTQSRLQHFTRFVDKTSYGLVNRAPGYWICDIGRFWFPWECNLKTCVTFHCGEIVFKTAIHYVC